jgi:hypothetical protein
MVQAHGVRVVDRAVLWGVRVGVGGFVAWMVFHIVWLQIASLIVLFGAAATMVFLAATE